MRLGLMALLLLGMMTDAWAACRCACVQGQARAICQPTDLMVPICSDLCLDKVEQPKVVVPLAGGRPVFEPVRPSNPSPNGVQEQNFDLNTDTRGNQLGAAGVQSGSSAFSSGR